MILMVLGIIVAWLLITRGGGFGQILGAATVMIESTETSTEITPTVLSPTKPPTPAPTFEGTATTRLPLGLDTPLGIDHEFMIHQIQDGESLDLIAGKHGTTVEALLACNYRLPTPLVTGWAIVVPLNIVDTQGLPAFEVYNVTEEISLEDVAIQLSVDLNEFKYYNAVGDDFTPRARDWLLVPRAISPTPQVSILRLCRGGSHAAERRVWEPVPQFSDRFYCFLHIYVNFELSKCRGLQQFGFAHLRSTL